MGLCDQSSAAALFRELPGEFVRRNSKGDSYVQVDLVGRSGLRYRIRTDFIALDAFERIAQTHYRAKGRGAYRPVKQDDFPWSQTFVSAYGPGIRTFGNADYSYYLPVDAVYSLFRYDAALQSPELVIRRLVDEAGKRNATKGRHTLNRLQLALAKLLNLKRPSDIELTKRGIFIRGSWGREELAALGDGYRATTTWTLDLMSWWLLYDDEPAHEFNAADLAGIVIIDELEQHLHPRWQRTILPQLRVLFPQLQFIVATHSPLVASSCPDVAVHRLDGGKHTIHQPYGWRAEDVYEMMGVPTSRAETFDTEVLQEYARLDAKRLQSKLSRAEQRHLTDLGRQLAVLPGDDPVRLAQELENLAKRAKQLMEPQ